MTTRFHVDASHPESERDIILLSLSSLLNPSAFTNSMNDQYTSPVVAVLWFQGDHFNSFLKIVANDISFMYLKNSSPFC